MTDVVNDVLIILAAGLIASLACRKVGISPLLGFLIAGAVLSPGGLGWVSDHNHEIEHIAEVGVFLLLFSIGLEFSLGELATLGRPLLIGGSLQMAFVAIPTGILLWLSGNSLPSVILVSCALAFSSTVLVFKGLAEGGHTSTASGRRAIAILLFQDAALVPLLLLVPLLTQEAKAPGWIDYIFLGLKSTLFVASIFLLRQVLRRWIIPTLANFRSPELVVLFTIVLLGGVTLGAYRLGLPPAVGAFAAGLVLSGNRWTRQIDALVLPFRESFAAVFFVSLGLLFTPGVILDRPFEMVGGFLALVCVKAVAATLALRFTGLNWKSSFSLGLGLAHVGEFAFVLLLFGWNARLLDEETYQKFVTLAFGTLLLTPILLKWGIRWIQREQVEKEVEHFSDLYSPRAALVVGMGPVGRRVATALETRGHQVHLIDRSAVNLYPFAQQGFHTIAGDATDLEILEAAHGHDAELAILCVPDDPTALEIVKQLRKLNEKAMIVVRCRFQTSELDLLQAGANEVVNEEHQVSQKLVNLLEMETNSEVGLANHT
ncbi:MAG: cation:proton antiporter [Gemmataceae bacterium]